LYLAIRYSKPLTSDAKGHHYFFLRRDANKYLVELGVLGPKQRIPLSCSGYGNRPIEKVAWQVNYKKLEQVWDKLLKIGKKEGISEQQWDAQRHYMISRNKLGKLRVDLEELK